MEIKKLAIEKFEKNKKMYNDLAKQRAINTLNAFFSKQKEAPNIETIITAYEYIKDEHLKIIRSRLETQITIEKLFPKEMVEESLKKHPI